MIKSAQRGRYGEGLETRDLEDIYRWTYKLQMLEREEQLGDYGMPALLPDRAYIEKAKLKTQLEEKLDEVYAVMTVIYDDWIERHKPRIEDYYDSAREYWSSKRWEIEHGHTSINEVVDWFGEGEVLTTIVEYLQEVMEEEAEERGEELNEDPYDAWIKYLDSVKAKKAQQRQFEFMDEEEVEPVGLQKPLAEMTLEEITELPLYKEHENAILDEIEESSYFDRAMELEAEQLLEYDEEYDTESPYGSIKSMREDMEEWDNLDIGGKIKLFQEALTTMHNNGEMAEYLLNDPNAVDILTNLSEGPNVPEWDYELSKTLGRPPGSTLVAPTQEWFVPAAIKHIASVISMLNIVESFMKKIAVIRKCKEGDAQEGKPWCLYDHKGEKLLGRHPSKESARKQESAIKAQASLYKVCNYLNKFADRDYPRNWQQFEEEYGESKSEHMPDPEEGLAEAIQEDLLAQPVDVFAEYVTDYYNQGVLTLEDFKELEHLTSLILDQPVQFESLEAFLEMVIQHVDDDVGSELSNEIAATIGERIVNDKSLRAEKESWISELKEKSMPLEELYGFR